MAHKTLAEMKANLMQSDEFRLAYEAELRKERLRCSGQNGNCSINPFPNGKKHHFRQL
ncbi:MAG: hypothetical protein E6662_17945 [Pantoea sp.]|nr:hypothetical protein [Pantoea sp.]